MKLTFWGADPVTKASPWRVIREVGISHIQVGTGNSIGASTYEGDFVKIPTHYPTPDWCGVRYCQGLVDGLRP